MHWERQRGGGQSDLNLCDADDGLEGLGRERLAWVRFSHPTKGHQQESSRIGRNPQGLSRGLV